MVEEAECDRPTTRNVVAAQGQALEDSMTSQMSELFAAAGLAAEDITMRLRALPERVQQLHRQVLHHIAATGDVPSPGQVENWATALAIDAKSALRSLADAELLFLDADDRVTGGVPFAAGTTAHQVHIAGGPVVSANCAIDALGIGAMLDRDIDITSLDPHSGEPVTATSRGGQWIWSPDQAVVFVGSSSPGRITETCCPVINFFTSPENAAAYQQQHHLTGSVLSMPDAADAGEEAFGPLLSEPSADAGNVGR
jgi:hypothetical protein